MLNKQFKMFELKKKKKLHITMTILLLNVVYKHLNFLVILLFPHNQNFSRLFSPSLANT